MPFIAGDFLDFVEEREAAEAEAKAKRDRGEFDPYSVRRPWWSKRLFWTIYEHHHDLNSAAPTYTSLPLFLSFRRACRVAWCLQRASRKAAS